MPLRLFKYFCIFLCISLLIAITAISVSDLQIWRANDKNRQILSQYSIRNLITPTPTPSNSITVILTGDVMLGRSVMKKTHELGDYHYPFLKVADQLNQADLVFINLENPIVKDCPSTSSGFKFCTDYEIAKGLVYAGVDIVNLANNHSENYGKSGLEETINYLDKLNVLTTGMGKLAIKEMKGTKFGFLGFDYVFKSLNPGDLALVKSSEPSVDILVVSVHWGDEYKPEANSFQRNLARDFVENGADVVVGHHPHWVQDIECFERTWGGNTDTHPVWTSFAPRDNNCPLGSKPVYYSLGNFVFDQMWSEETKKGLAVKLTFNGEDIIKQELLPIYIFSVGQPEFVK